MTQGAFIMAVQKIEEKRQISLAIEEDISRLSTRADHYFKLFEQSLIQQGKPNYDEEAQAQTIGAIQGLQSSIVSAVKKNKHLSLPLK